MEDKCFRRIYIRSGGNDRAKISTTLKNQVPRAIVLDPVVVKGKGRPKAQKGKGSKALA
jgi:hypothetical protein